MCKLLLVQGPDYVLHIIQVKKFEEISIKDIDDYDNKNVSDADEKVSDVISVIETLKDKFNGVDNYDDFLKQNKTTG